MDYRLLIARRFLVSRRRVTLVSIISGISVAGIAIGVSALIVVLSVMNGFYAVVRDLLVSLDPHVRIVATDARGVEDPDSLRAVALALPHVVTASPYVEGKALLTGTGTAGFNKVVIVRGVDPASMSADAGVEAAVTTGTFNLERSSGPPGVIVGYSLASRLGLYPGLSPDDGARIDLLSAPALERLLIRSPFGLPPQQTYVVRGLYELEPAYDQSNVFIALPEAQRLFRLGARVSGVELRLDDLNRAEAVKRDLSERLDPARFTVQTWYDLQKSLYDVMRLEKWGATFILALLVVVAAFNIIGSLTMIVIEKRRDIGALQAMGASRRAIRQIFLAEGLLVGALGTGIGLVAGLGLALLQKQFGLVKLTNAESFIIDAYPVDIQLVDVALIVVLALGLCMLAAVYPATRAAAVAPAESVRSGS